MIEYKNYIQRHGSLSCKHCTFNCRTVEGMIKHLNKIHTIEQIESDLRNDF